MIIIMIIITWIQLCVVFCITPDVPFLTQAANDASKSLFFLSFFFSNMFIVCLFLYININTTIKQK